MAGLAWTDLTISFNVWPQLQAQAQVKLKALLENYSLYTRQVHISFVFLWLRETATVGTNYHYHHPRSLIEASWGIWSFLTQLTKSNHVLRLRRRNRMLPSESGIGGNGVFSSHIIPWINTNISLQRWQRLLFISRCSCWYLSALLCSLSLSEMVVSVDRLQQNDAQWWG